MRQKYKSLKSDRTEVKASEKFRGVQNTSLSGTVMYVLGT